MRTKFVVLLLVAVSGLMAQSGARYLIITHDDFYSAIQPLVEWKTKKGMLCVVKKTSEVGTTSSMIRSFVVTAYNTWNPQPEFLLLVGGPSFIPAFNWGMGPSAIQTDNPYGSMSGDYRVELPYGRLPCKTARQCSIMVAKILTYERQPDRSDTMWYHKMTLIVNDSADSDAPTYWSDVRTVASMAAPAGFSQIDSLASLRHHDASSVAQSVNGGTSFVLYRGGATDYWHAPFDMRAYLGGLTNFKHLPIVCSFTCQTVSLSSYNDSMTGNTWVKVGTPTNPYGAVAVVGNTHSASHVAGKRSAMTRGFFTGVFAESLFHLGSAVMRGKLQLYNEYHDSMDYAGFTLLGDPEMGIWTSVPQPLQVSYPEYVPFGAQNFTVQAMRNAVIPVRNALVCIQSNSGIYQYGYTDDLGTKTFSINPAVEEMLGVTVTARNCAPFEGSAQIYDPSAVREATRRENSPLVTRHSSLLKVAPNPGHGRFSISAHAGDALPAGTRLSIYRHDGRMAGSASVPGSGTVVWNAGAEPSGIYLVRAVTADGRQLTGTLQLVK
jgi:hypothetical protein